MSPAARLLATLGAAGMAAALLAGCGKTAVPQDAVALVDDRAIERSAFDRWMRIGAHSSTSAGGETRASVVVPSPSGATCGSS